MLKLELTPKEYETMTELLEYGVKTVVLGVITPDTLALVNKLLLAKNVYLKKVKKNG